MYCTNCGKQIDDNAVICSACGVPTKNYNKQVQETDDSMGCLMGGLCFLLPIVGLILYLIWKDSKPISARFCARWGLFGFILEIILSIAWIVLFIVFQANIYNWYY
jgi:uncharacterized membrane protein YvbJ